MIPGFYVIREYCHTDLKKLVQVMSCPITYKGLGLPDKEAEERGLESARVWAQFCQKDTPAMRKKEFAIIEVKLILPPL
jgi:hypothetical protein